MIRRPPPPSARADSMNGKPITSSTAARTTRANAGTMMIPIAIIAFRRVAPSRPAITIASTMPREREHDVDDAHEQQVDDPAAVAGDQADQRAGDERDRDRDDADLERHLGAVDDAREGVAAEVVGAERVRPARPEQPVGVRVRSGRSSR